MVPRSSPSPTPCLRSVLELSVPTLAKELSSRDGGQEAGKGVAGRETAAYTAPPAPINMWGLIGPPWTRTSKCLLDHGTVLSSLMWYQVESK